MSLILARATDPPTPLPRAAVPAALYLGLSFLDLACSLRAFSFGVAEGNPFMAWLVAVGCFVPAKVLMSVVLAGLMATIVRASHRFAWAAWGSVALMAGVAAIHWVGLSRLG